MYTNKDKVEIAKLQSLGYRSIFFIVTRYDDIKASVAMEEDSEQSFQEYVYKMLSPCTDLGRDGIKFVDSRDALRGWAANDSQWVAKSGLSGVEESLQRFLVEQKGKSKLGTSRYAVCASNQAARVVIPGRIAMQLASIEDLEMRYRSVGLPLKNLQTTRELIVGRIDLAITNISRRARDLAESYFLTLPDKIRMWAENCELAQGVGFPPRTSTLEPLVKEVCMHIESCLDEEIAAWSRCELSPVIDAGITEMQTSLVEDARKFFNKIEEIRVTVTLGANSTSDVVQQSNPSVLSRLAGVGYVLVTGDIFTGAMGAFMGIKAMVTSIVCQVVAGIVLVVLGMLNPFAIIVAAVTAIVSGNWLNILSLKKGIKKKVADMIVDKIISRRGELGEQVEVAVSGKLQKIRQDVDGGLAASISGVRGEVEAALEQKRSGTVDAESAIEKLRSLERENLEVAECLELVLDEGATAAKS